MVRLVDWRKSFCSTLREKQKIMTSLTSQTKMSSSLIPNDEVPKPEKTQRETVRNLPPLDHQSLSIKPNREILGSGGLDLGRSWTRRSHVRLQGLSPGWEGANMLKNGAWVKCRRVIKIACSFPNNLVPLLSSEKVWAQKDAVEMSILDSKFLVSTCLRIMIQGLSNREATRPNKMKLCRLSWREENQQQI